MKLSAIFPRPLEKGAADTAALLRSLVMTAHLDRARARALGWRGVIPAGEKALTAKIAQSEQIFGLRFLEEEVRDDALCGHFEISVFPPTNSPLLDHFPLAALNVALSPGYLAAVRDYANSGATLAPFTLGAFRLCAPFAGDAIWLELEAPARLQIISRDGVQGPDGWIVRPGALECDVPAFRLPLRFFATLAATAEDAFGEKPRLAMRAQPCAVREVTSSGELRDTPGGEGRAICLRASFGASPPAPGRELARLPACRPPKNAALPCLHVLTGFLGAGKTTFLKRWLDFLHGRERYTGVIQNEFGPVDLDSALLRGDTLVEALDDGCVCCSLAASLRPGLERICGELPAAQFILETTGVANPANVRLAIAELADLVRPGLTICVADGGRLAKNGLPQGGLEREQLAFADVIVVNKADLLPEGPAALGEALSRLNPGAELFFATEGAIPFGRLDALLDRLRPLLPNLRGVTHKDENFGRHVLFFARPVSREELEDVIALFGPALDRAKGILEIVRQGPCVAQYASKELRISKAPGLAPAGMAFMGRALDLPENLPAWALRGTS